MSLSTCLLGCGCMNCWLVGGRRLWSPCSRFDGCAVGFECSLSTKYPMMNARRRRVYRCEYMYSTCLFALERTASDPMCTPSSIS